MPDIYNKLRGDRDDLLTPVTNCATVRDKAICHSAIWGLGPGSTTPHSDRLVRVSVIRVHIDILRVSVIRIHIDILRVNVIRIHTNVSRQRTE